MKKCLMLAVLTLIFIAFAVPVAFAQDVEPELSETLLTGAKMVFMAVMSSIATSAIGYLKSTPKEDFNAVKLLATIITGIIVGVITLQFGWNYATSEEWLGNIGATVYIYWIAKIIAVKAGWIEPG